jgi:hypothetical protein
MWRRQNFWGIATHVGGIHDHVVSIVTNPNTDRHSYETATVGYRAWPTKQLLDIEAASARSRD